MAQMERAGGIGGDELHVEGLARITIDPSVGVPGNNHVSSQFPERCSVQGDVEESGAGNIDFGNSVNLTKLPGNQFGHGPRTALCRLCQDQGDVCGVITMLGILGSLNHHLAGHLRGLQRQRSTLDTDDDAVTNGG